MAEENLRSYRATEPERRGSANRTSQGGSDPLAELARLIGQNDPFADIGREAVRAAPAAPPPAPVQPVYAAPDPYAAAQHVPPAGTPAPPLPTEQSYHQGYDPYGEQNSAYAAADQQYGDMSEPHQAAYDAYYAQDGQYADPDQYEPAPPPKRRGGMVAVFAILALAVFGSAGAYAYRTYFHRGPSAPPPVIKADTAPTKIIPAAHAAGAPANKAIYDRVGDRNQVEKMVPREEQPVDVKKAAGPPPAPPVVQISPPATAANTPVTPVPVSVVPVAGSAAGQAVPSVTMTQVPVTPPLAVSPRKVKTVTIRPDSPFMDADAQAANPAPAAPPARQRSASAAPPAPVTPAQPPRPAPPPAAAAAPPRAVAHAPNPHAPLSLTPQAVAAERPAPSPRGVAPLALAAAPPPAAHTGSISGSYAVQVASQRSEADARTSFRALQAKYPNVLGGRQAFVRRADLGSRGVYYRSMVGPFANAEEAKAFCSSLKAAGGQCLIQRN